MSSLPRKLVAEALGTFMLVFFGCASIVMTAFPGGNWGDLNDIEEWQICQFLPFAQQAGWEPMINARLRGGTAGSPARARTQFAQPQFHCGRPPPAAEPSTRTLTPGPDYS